MIERRTLLLILDGWGITDNPRVSAPAQAHTPFIDSCLYKYPNSKLKASGLAVGLPEGQMGNSEVGHINLGAGRVVYQNLTRINKAIEDAALSANPILKQILETAKKGGKSVHFIGLLSDGGVHSHIDHLKALLRVAADYGLQNVFVHAFADGRDTDPKSGLSFVKEIQSYMAQHIGTLASVIGRYYAMDRDHRWARTKLAYDLLTRGEGKRYTDAQAAVRASYGEGITDEFIKPVVITDEFGKPKAVIETGDVVICYNFRTDRARQITEALTQRDFPKYDMRKLNLDYNTLTHYEDTFVGIKVLFENERISHTLGEVLEARNKTQLRLAETEKYPHVTFFFNGGREEVFRGERRILVPSPRVATYDLQPEMSAYAVRDKAIEEMDKRPVDFICLNFANSDMVGHTGVFPAAVKACETVDRCAGAVVEAAMRNRYATIMLADHGNAEFMINADGTPNTAHTTAWVPCSLITADKGLRIKDGSLSDVAPSLLHLMNIPIPREMTGDNLITDG